VELDDAAWALLHELRLRGKVSEAGGEVDAAVVTRLVEGGFATRTRSAVVITAVGRTTHETWARCTPGSDAEAALRRAYDRFLPLNADLIRVCNDWQVRAGDVHNDHTDVEYDWSVVDRLRALHDRSSPVTRSMATSITRFDAHRTRLRVAIRRVEAGEHDWFTSPRLDSYHTVWMQMHEDLLLALGIDRATEVPA
jgi:hypothetical protein